MEKKYKQFLFIIFFLGGFLVWQNAQAADHYIRADAAGNNDGSNWINAWVEMPTSWTRGDVYYVAGGTYTIPASQPTYPVIYLSDATINGTIGTIVIKKATMLDHGTGVGWNDSYALQAYLHNGTINSLQQKATIYIKASDIEIDGGQYGNQTDPDTYGFKVLYPGDNTYGSTGALGDPDLNTSYRSGLDSVWVPDTSTTNFSLSNIKLKGLAIIGPGEVPCLMRQAGDGSTYTCYMSGIGGISSNASDITIDSCYISDFPQNVSFVNLSDIVIKNSYLTHDVGSATGAHPENINLDSLHGALIYNNIVHNSVTFLIGIHKQRGGEMTGLKIYNNLFIKSNSDRGDLTGGIAVMDDTTDNVYGAYVVNNTFVDISFGGKGAFMVGNLTDSDTNKSYFYNNLIYNSSNPRSDNVTYTSGAIVHDNNAYLKCTGTINSADETSPQRDDGAADPFIDSANGDYGLKIGTLPINNGKNDLGATYSYDFAGNLRDESPDIGAYEYVSETSDTISPAAPTNLAVQ